MMTVRREAIKERGTSDAMILPTDRGRTRCRKAGSWVIPAAVIAVFVLLSIIGPDAWAATYTVGGTVSGISGSGLVLQDNGGDDLAVSANGSFTFASPVAEGSSYDVTVETEPDSPAQGCMVQYGSGTVAGSDVTGIKVTCITGRYNIVDTNQTKCYDSNTGDEVPCTGVGYDADYSGNQPSYTLSADGKVVKDNVTGLVWTQSTDTNGDGSVNYSDKMSPSDAELYCSGLDLDGYAWRLPTIKELYSLIEYSGTDASSYTGTDTSVLTPFISSVFDWAFGDQSAGDRIIDGQYATSTNYVWTTMLGNATMFGVNFVDGRIKGYPTSLKVFYVRCVAGSSSYGINDFVDNGDGTVTDEATGLMWEQDDHGPMDFDNAVSTCETATTAGYDDWRLPNAKELQSILDYDRSPDYTNSAAIDPVFNATSFYDEGFNGSCETTDWGYYWGSTTHVKYGGAGDYATYDSFGRALGYFDADNSGQQILDVHGAGAQRSDNKVSPTHVAGVATADVGCGTFYYHGPQGDIMRSSNYVRCVRDDKRSDQTITFGALPDKVQGDADFDVSASASSGLTVSFSSSTTDVCTASSTTVSLVGVGTCTIVASQSGNRSYYAAPDVSQSFTVSTDIISGTCGSDNGQTLSSTPTNLCDTGNSSVVTGDGPWTWTCSGVNGGTAASCYADVSSCSGHQLLMLNSDSTEYGSFADALASATDGDTILIGPMAVSEDVNIDASGLSLLLQGGWDCDFGDRTGTGSTVQGSITVTDGTVEMDEVTIE